jgi:uncharacterized protein YcfJ
MKKALFLIMIPVLTSCHKEPHYFTVTNCSETKERKVHKCENSAHPILGAVGGALAGHLLGGAKWARTGAVVGGVAGAAGATNTKCYDDVESYCANYKTEQVENKNYHGDVYDWGM